MNLMRPCPVCSNIARVDLGELTNTAIAPLEHSSYHLHHCRDCDIVYLSPLPTAHDLNAIYVDQSQFDYYDEERERVVTDFMANRLRDVLARLGTRQAPAVLEIGAGLAWMARAAKQISPHSQGVAQDITAEVAEKCSWVDHYIVGPDDDPRIDSLGPYDVISLTHVIEHVPDPAAMLRRLRPVTRGMIFITAPHRPVRWDGTMESWLKYSYNHVPAHLQYFSEKGMGRMAKAAGFKVAYWDASSEEGQAFEAWLEPVR